eukprot:6654007-Alexandrium_andersonii.AAC.1
MALNPAAISPFRCPASRGPVKGTKADRRSMSFQRTGPMAETRMSVLVDHVVIKALTGDPTQ